ncbi:DUF309 domain-containing protein [Paenibacillus sp. GCM10027626]|uniref:DUF309 domain-containing protein n=1 Tax=Paenibacillus sp. GCM10027626 TaxID=3273411 RepID=UPI00363F04C6
MNHTIYPAAYVRFLVEFHVTRDYFECHELLEEHWKEQRSDDPLAEVWVGLIQLAVGSYHHRRGNLPGALKMFKQAHRRLSAGELPAIGLAQEALVLQIRTKIAAVKNNQPFRDFNLPLTDPQLWKQCWSLCISEMRGSWGRPSGTEAALIDRHRLRDRSDVILARQAAAQAKLYARRTAQM